MFAIYNNYKYIISFILKKKKNECFTHSKKNMFFFLLLNLNYRFKTFFFYY